MEEGRADGQEEVNVYKVMGKVTRESLGMVRFHENNTQSTLKQ